MQKHHNELIKKSDVDINLAYLDTIDFKPYLESTRNIGKLIEAVESDYLNDPNMPPELGGEVFDWLDEYDFALYLKKRYGNMRIVERHYTEIYIEDD